MKKRKAKHIKDTMIMIEIMSDDIPIYDFNLLKHMAIASIDKIGKTKKTKRKTDDMFLSVW